MNVPFPFGFPWQTVLYLVLYVVTLSIHVAFMNYVLAGTGYLAFSAVFPGSARSRYDGALAQKLREWVPVMLSGAITAGVAPLLFVQILYRYEFYTANLLGFHRWMAILPILIVAFYMLYLIRGDGFAGMSMTLRTVLGVIAFVMFAFVAWSWTENYLLSMASEQTWASEYASSSLFYRDKQLIPRLGVWFVGALPTMALIGAWQLHYVQVRGNEQAGAEARRCSMLALGGMIGAGIFGVIYFAIIDADTRASAFSVLALPYVVLALVGLGLQGWGWFNQMKLPTFDSKLLTLISAGTTLTVLGMTVIREVVRVRAIDITTLFDQHKLAAEKGGLFVFLFFFAANIAAVIWCFVLVRKGLAKDEKDAVSSQSATS